jgi:uncharacterized protein (TIGR02996 family)
MDQRQAHFDVITAPPEDNAPRLAFADWLEGQGDPE